MAADPEPNLLTGALPIIIKPPQSPGLFTLWLEEKIIGSVSVPFAIIDDPLEIVRDPLVLKSPNITVPASMLSLVLSVTKTLPSKRYTSLL